MASTFISVSTQVTLLFHHPLACLDKIRYCLLCNVRPPAQNANHVITKKVKDVKNIQHIVIHKFDNQTNTLHYQIHETFKHNETY